MKTQTKYTKYVWMMSQSSNNMKPKKYFYNIYLWKAYAYILLFAKTSDRIHPEPDCG